MQYRVRDYYYTFDWYMWKMKPEKVKGKGIGLGIKKAVSPPERGYVHFPQVTR